MRNQIKSCGQVSRDARAGPQTLPALQKRIYTLTRLARKPDIGVAGGNANFSNQRTDQAPAQERPAPMCAEALPPEAPRCMFSSGGIIKAGIVA